MDIGKGTNATMIESWNHDLEPRTYYCDTNTPCFKNNQENSI